MDCALGVSLSLVPSLVEQRFILGQRVTEAVLDRSPLERLFQNRRPALRFLGPVDKTALIDDVSDLVCLGV